MTPPENIEPLKKMHPPAAPAFNDHYFVDLSGIFLNHTLTLSKRWSMVDSTLNKLHGATGPSRWKAGL